MYPPELELNYNNLKTFFYAKKNRNELQISIFCRMATLVFERLEQLNLTGNIANFGENMEKKKRFHASPYR